MSIESVVIDLDSVVLRTSVVPILAAGSEFADELKVVSEAVDTGRLSSGRAIELTCRLLDELAVAEAQRRVAAIGIDREVRACLEVGTARTTVVTALPRQWIAPLIDQLPCQVVSSEGRVVDGVVAGIERVADKAGLVRAAAETVGTVLAVGGSADDVAMLESASLRVVFGSDPPAAVREVADYLTPTGRALWNLLTSL